MGFVQPVPPQQPLPVAAQELQELKRLVEEQRLAMEGTRKELAEVSAKSQADVKRKMVGVPPVCKAELLNVRELDSKAQWVFTSLLVLSLLLWRTEVPAHEYVSRFRDKEKFTDAMLDELAPVTDADAVDNEAWCWESMDDTEIERMRAFVTAVWTFTVTSLLAYRGKRGLEAKSQPWPDDEEHEMPARSRGCTGAAEEDVVAKRLVAMNAKFKMDGDRRLYTAKPGGRAHRRVKRAGDGLHGVQKCGEGRETPLVSRVPRV